MPTIPPSGLFYPNRFVRYLFLAMEDVMGTQGLASTRVLAEWEGPSLPPDDLERAVDFAALTRLNLALNASRLIEQPGTFQFVVAHSPFAHRISAERPVCHLLVGVLQEALRWVSNGRDYSVRETHCVATGSENCIFVINRHPFA